jgi:ABC-type multidrug transport system permease subunit
VQVTVLLIVSSYLFGIDWGSLSALVPAAAGIVFTASSFGIFINSLMKDTKQGGVVFGGVLTLSGMIGIIGIITMGSPSSAALGNSVSLLVPQGWAVHGLVQAMGGKPEREVLLTLAALLAWGIVFFITGVWRFNRRYT